MCLIKSFTLTYNIDFKIGVSKVFRDLASLQNDSRLPDAQLFRYLENRFYLALIKDALHTEGDYSTFNTGLTNRWYQPIYALLKKNEGPHPQKYQFVCWAVPGEGTKINSLFTSLPGLPRLFDSFDDLHYDLRLGTPTISVEHALDRIERFPKQFLNRICGITGDLTSEEYRAAINESPIAMNLFRSSLESAVSTAVRRVSTDLFTAVPTYYFREQRISLLLPLSLSGNDVVDLALVVVKNEQGTAYVGRTVFTLDQAYSTARVLGRVGNWLAA